MGGITCCQMSRLLHTAVGEVLAMGHLDVAVEQLSAVHVLERPEQLVHDELLVDVLQDVGPDDRMQVRLHVLEHQVDVPVILRFQHILQPALAKTGSAQHDHRGPSSSCTGVSHGPSPVGREGDHVAKEAGQGGMFSAPSGGIQAS